MDILESLFGGSHSLSLPSTAKLDLQDEADSGDEDGEMDLDVSAELLAAATASVSSINDETPKRAQAAYPRRSRPERGKFTILDNMEVAEVDDIIDVEFNVDILQNIFQDPRLGVQFLARYGLIPNSRSCRLPACPRDQLMSLIKHANGYVWRCRSCRKRTERRIITKISVYEGTFLFYSRMPLNKLFIFMYIWCENPGFTISEYNRILGEYRLVEETIYNTIGFLRDHVQNWCTSVSLSRIGGEGQTVEIMDTLHTEQLSCKQRNRRTRNFGARYALICWTDNSIVTVPDIHPNPSPVEISQIIHQHAELGSKIVMRDLFIEECGGFEDLKAALGDSYSLTTISEEWLTLSEEEKDKQFIKTEMMTVQNYNQEPFAYEYFFRRTFPIKPFNELLRIIRQLYSK